MACVRSGMATLAAGPAMAAGLRMDSLDSAGRSSPSSLLMGPKKNAIAAGMVSSRGVAVKARASASEQGSEFWTVAKGAAVAAAISLVLSASPVEAREGRASRKVPINATAEASRNVLESVKNEGDALVADAEMAMQESAAQAVNVRDALPAVSQLSPEVQAATSNAVTAKVDAAPDTAPAVIDKALKKTKGPNPMRKKLQAAAADASPSITEKAKMIVVRKGPNPIRKKLQAAADAAPTIVDKVVKKGPNAMGKNYMSNARAKAAIREEMLAAKRETLPRINKPYKEGTGFADRIYNSFRAAGDGRNAGVGVRAQ